MSESDLQHCVNYNTLCGPSQNILTSVLINGILRVLQKLLKYFNGTIISTLSIIPLLSV